MKYIFLLTGVIAICLLLCMQQREAKTNTTILTEPTAPSAGTTLGGDGDYGLYKPTPKKNVTQTTLTWLETDTSIAAPFIRHDVPNLSLFGIERQKFMDLQAGDSVTMSLPKPSQNVSIWVDKVVKNASGSLTITGKVDGYADYSFVMTLGPETTFATIGTSSGVFNLRGNKSHAWIGLARSFNHHVNPDTPDYRIVEPDLPTESNS
jgi:hypothetical protein